MLCPTTTASVSGPFLTEKWKSLHSFTKQKPFLCRELLTDIWARLPRAVGGSRTQPPSSFPTALPGDLWNVHCSPQPPVGTGLTGVRLLYNLKAVGAIPWLLSSVPLFSTPDRQTYAPALYHRDSTWHHAAKFPVRLRSRQHQQKSQDGEKAQKLYS